MKYSREAQELIKRKKARLLSYRSLTGILVFSVLALTLGVWGIWGASNLRGLRVVIPVPADSWITAWGLTLWFNRLLTALNVRLPEIWGNIELGIVGVGCTILGLFGLLAFVAGLLGSPKETDHLLVRRKAEKNAEITVHTCLNYLKDNTERQEKMVRPLSEATRADLRARAVTQFGPLCEVCCKTADNRKKVLVRDFSHKDLWVEREVCPNCIKVLAAQGSIKSV